jgi:hypothetical protein
VSCSACVDNPCDLCFFENYNVNHGGLQKCCYCSQQYFFPEFSKRYRQRSVEESCDGLISAQVQCELEELNTMQAKQATETK